MNQINPPAEHATSDMTPTATSNVQSPVAVIGLGYVGLPLALALSRNHAVIGVDVDRGRISELRDHHDRTGEADRVLLEGSEMTFSEDINDAANSGVFIITVPTPVGPDNAPDLSIVCRASEMVGAVLKPGAIVVYESTVYPGVTEEICGPILEQASGLTCGVDFHLGYSPERINPGDGTHTVDKITKVVAGQTPAVTDILADLYGTVTTGGIFRAADIRTAEAAKVIENAQRDINIAFINEIAAIFNKLGISTHDVLDAARTKWNFLDFRPGLVGGHCIGVDPFYLAHAAKNVGHEPEVILAGRRINDGLPALIAERIESAMSQDTNALPQNRVLVLGITFKENCPDVRNSKAADLIKALQDRGHVVDTFDPIADADEVRREYGIDLLDDPMINGGAYDAVVAAVAHRDFNSLGGRALGELVKPGGVAADVKGLWRLQGMPATIRRWEL